MHKTPQKPSVHRRKTRILHPKSGVVEYYGYRDYNAASGRWTARDPIAEQGGLNLYGMVGNDAVRRVDVLGMADEFPRYYKKQTMEIDADGAPNAYHPKNIGLDKLKHAGFKPLKGTKDSYDVDRSYPTKDSAPYGVISRGTIEANSGNDENLKTTWKPVIQTDNDPFPGYYVSATSWSKGNDPFSPYSYVNADLTPYIVYRDKVMEKGKLATVVRTSKVVGNQPEHHHAVTADYKGSTEGEASMALARLFGVNPSPIDGGTLEKDFCYIIYDKKADFPNFKPTFKENGYMFSDALYFDKIKAINKINSENARVLYEKLEKDNDGIPCKCKKVK